jgi:uncharacterized membrane protein YfcA
MLIIVTVKESIPWAEFMRAFFIEEWPALIIPFVGALLCGIAGLVILERVDRELAGFTLGFFLGPIGLIIAWVMRDNALRNRQAFMTRHAKNVDDVRARLRERDRNR